MNRGLTGRMVVASALLAVIVAAAFALLLVAIANLRDSTQLGRETQDELAAADDLERLVFDLETGLRGFVITREARFLEPWNDARADLPGTAATLERLATAYPTDLAQIERILQAARDYIRGYGIPLVAAVRRRDPSVRSADSTDEGKQRADALRASFSRLRQEGRERLSAREAAAQSDARRATVAAAIGVTGSMLLILVFTGYLSRVIVTPIRRVAGAAGRLAGGDLTVRLSEQGVGEIGQLERAFNRMGGSLAVSQEELRRLAFEQAALRRVATLVAREASQEEIFNAIAVEIAQLLGTADMRMLRYEGDAEGVIVGTTGALDVFPVGARYPLEGEHAGALVLRTGRSARIDDYRKASGPIAEAARSAGVRGVVGTPIVVEGQLWGAMVATTDRDEPLPPETESRLEQFTELMATAIANTETRARADRLASEQAALRRVATLIAEEAPPAEVFAKVADEVATVLGDVQSSLWRDECDGTASLVAVSGIAIPIGTRLPIDGDGAIATVLREGRPCQLNDNSGRSGAIVERGHELGTGAAIGCPVVVGGRLWGALGAARRRSEPFPRGTESRLAQFAELVATAIASADARAAVQRLADEQAGLRRVATLVAEGSSAAVVLDAVAAEMQRVLGAQGVTLMRYEPGEEATVVAHRGPGAQTLPPGMRVGHRGENVTSLVRRTERSARLEHYETTSGDIAEIVHQLGVRAAVGAPVVLEGRLWGVAVANWTGDALPPADTEARMTEFVGLLETAIANADSREQLTASRARLLTAADEARRRVVRDLHDGAQQRLVHTIVSLKLAEHALKSGGPEARALVVEALEQAERGNSELRELAHGVLPAVLTHGGLRAGVDAVVARVDVLVDVDVTTDRFPSEIEASAYFIVAEALTNVVKHAYATRAEVRVARDDGMLNIEVRDDGIGGADPEGHGLVGLADRATTLGGRFIVDSSPRGGTVVIARIPLTGT